MDLLLEAITTMLWPYVMKDFTAQFNELNVNDDEINPMEKFTYTTTDITIKHHHTWGCRVYVLDAGLQHNIAGLPKWEPCSRA